MLSNLPTTNMVQEGLRKVDPKLPLAARRALDAKEKGPAQYGTKRTRFRRCEPTFGLLIYRIDRQRLEKNAGQKSRRRVARRTRFLPSHAPCVQRSQRGLRVLLQSEYRLLRQALGLRDGR
jgi:hypothetical protein